MLCFTGPDTHWATTSAQTPPQPQALCTKKPSSLIPTPSSLHTYKVGVFTLYLLVTFH